MKRAKKFLLLHILKEIKKGSSPSKILKKFNISKQNLNYYRRQLEKKGCIIKKGYAVWEYIKPLISSKKEVKTLTIRHSKKKEIRGHAFIWKIQFYNPLLWEEIIKNYHKKSLNFQFMKHNKQFRLIFQNRKIWLGKKGMTIYEAFDFRARSSFQSKGKAVFEMDLLIKNLLKELNLKFRPYKFTTSREHYGIMKHELARQYNKRKEKMKIISEDGDVWMWIDDSKGLGELENKDPTINRQVQNYWNDHKKHKFEVNADFILKGFNKTTGMIKQNAEHLDFHAKNMRTHVEAVQELGNAVKILSEKVEKL